MKRFVEKRNFGRLLRGAIACAIAFLLTVSVLPLSGFDTADAAESTGTSGKTDWMGDIEDKIYVSHLSIPGSHQAAAWNPRGNTRLFARCQDASFKAQLDAGLRAFDIRYKWVGGANPASWYLYHGEDNWHYELQNDDDVHMDIFYFLDQVTAWLKEHPTEFIIVNFQKEMGNVWTDTQYKEKILAKYGGSASDNYESGTIVPYWKAASYNQLKVGDVRGRIIDGSKFMQGVSGDYNSWQTPFDNKVQQMNRCFDNAPSISKSNSSSYNYIEQKVIYTNLACNAAGGVDLTYPETYAKEMRKYLFQYNVFTNGSKNGTVYDQRGQKAYGIVLYDYVTQDQNCIDYNVQANDWAKKNVYQVSFETNGAEQPIVTQNIQEGNGVDYPWKQLTKTGYTFLGWFKDAACKTPFKFATNKSNNTQNPANQIDSANYDKPTQNMTLYAGWAKNTYQIDYVLNGGSMKSGETNPTSYDYGKVTDGFLAPEKTGYTFEGWYSDVNLTKKVDSISATHMGDLTLYAKWKVNTYEITYNSDIDGFAHSNPLQFEYLSNTITLQDATKDGYVFLGWYNDSGVRVSTIATNVASNITLTARWETTVCAITYHNIENLLDTEIAKLPKEYTYSKTDAVTLPVLSKEYYYFGGWFADRALSIVADTIEAGTTGAVERYAKWTPKSYAINYVLGEIPEGHDYATQYPSITSYSYGQAIDELEVPVKYGNTFLGWYTDEACTEGNEVTSIVAGDSGEKTFYAKWTSRLNTITYIDGYSNPNPTEFYYAEGLKLLPATRDGYTFQEWSTTPNKIVGLPTTVAEIKPYQSGNNIKLYGLWTPNTYKITYLDQQGSVLTDTGNASEYTVGTGVPTLSGPGDKENLKFVGWFIDPSDTTSKRTGISKETWGDIELVAVYSEDGEYDYPITYNLDGGEEPNQANPQTYIHGYGVSKFNEPTKANYDFAGWKDAQGAIVDSISKEQKGAVELTATWTPKVYTITYDTDGGDVIEPDSYTYGSTFTELPTPVRPYSTFKGWFTKEGMQVVSISETDSGNFELVAHWESEKWTITYVGAQGTPTEYTYGIGVEALSVPVKEHYTFEGWSDGTDIITSIPRDRHGEITLTAVWSPAKYPIVYELDGGEQTGNPDTYTYGQTTLIPNIPTRAGYTFKGWTKDGSELTSIDANTSGEVTLLAQWGLADYSIEYDYNGGSAPSTPNPESYRYTYGVEVLNSPERENYEFEGWYKDGVKVSGIDTTMSGDITLVANWTPKTFTVRYDYAGGQAASLYNATQYSYGTGIASFYDAKKDNYKFAGWQDVETGNVVSSIGKSEARSFNLKALWIAQTYKISYELYGGEIEKGNPTEYTYGQGAAIAKKPTKANFKFGGWSYGGVIRDDETLTLSAATSGDVKLYAHWIAESYTIEYDYAGGSAGSVTANVNGQTQTITNPTTYSYGEGVTDLIDPIAPEYSDKKFAGWYIGNTKVDSISTTQSGNVVLVAKWVNKNTTVQLSSLQGTGEVQINGTTMMAGTSQVVSEGKDLTITWTPKASNESDISIIKTIKVNGIDQNAFAKIDKSKWQSTNTDYKARMKDTSDAKMVTYDNIISNVQTLTVSAATLASLNTDTYTVDVEFMDVSPVYRMYNMITSEHMFTTNKEEYDNFDTLSKARKDYWICEGIDWLAPSSTDTTTNSKQVYRLYNKALGQLGHSSHYYTSDVNEMNNLVKNHGWTVDEGNGFMSGGENAIYTCYNEGLGSAHHYTSSKSEWQTLQNHGWDLELDKNGYGKTGVFSATLSTK